ncbi:hypothetical protein TPA0909_59390 [Streptomyces albus]|nr:hypothetical protein TPA0909_59390 [Streptomyces albus]
MDAARGAIQSWGPAVRAAVRPRARATPVPAVQVSSPAAGTAAALMRNLRLSMSDSLPVVYGARRRVPWSGHIIGQRDG